MHVNHPSERQTLSSIVSLYQQNAIETCMLVIVAGVKQHGYTVCTQSMLLISTLLPMFLHIFFLIESCQCLLRVCNLFKQVGMFYIALFVCGHADLN